jgi:N-acetylmuramic acid 6-phosphate etherase
MAGPHIPPTEERNPRTADLDRMPLRRVLEILNDEDRSVGVAVSRAMADIERAAGHAVDALSRGGRLVYIGAGTSGRLAALDAAEIPPTFGLSPERVVAVMAGGAEALDHAVEGAEDDALEGVARARDLALGPSDCVVGVTASGTTRFVLGALGEARERGAATVLLTCGARPVSSLWHAVIAVETGPEVVAGSTRLKAGTATKMVLNMISTAAMVQLGKVHDNLMVDVVATNDKLRRRAQRIVETLAGVAPPKAREALDRCGGETKTAIVSLVRGLEPGAARERLAARGGILRRALEEA